MVSMTCFILYLYCFILMHSGQTGQKYLACSSKIPLQVLILNAIILFENK